MDLITASAQGLPLVYRVPGTDIESVAAHVFPHPDGAIVVDPGWGGDAYGPHTGHPFHIVRGMLQGTGSPWFVSEMRFRQLDHGDTMAHAWNLYQAFLDTPYGREQTREACAHVLERLGYLSSP